jgi:nitrate reductase delta subunit
MRDQRGGGARELHQEAAVKPWAVLSELLLYPEEAELADVDGPSPVRRFVDRQRELSPAERRTAYVEAFDFDRRATLHLTYHTLGDRRQRGLELVRLKRRYAVAGLELDATELPDYLPVMLEFAALAPEAGEALLNEHRPAIELVRARLHERESPYAELLDALVDALPRATRAQLEAARRVAEGGPPTELVGLPFSSEGSRMVNQFRPEGAELA